MELSVEKETGIVNFKLAKKRVEGSSLNLYLIALPFWATGGVDVSTWPRGQWAGSTVDSRYTPEVERGETVISMSILPAARVKETWKRLGTLSVRYTRQTEASGGGEMLLALARVRELIEVVGKV